MVSLLPQLGAPSPADIVRSSALFRQPSSHAHPPSLHAQLLSLHAPLQACGGRQHLHLRLVALPTSRHQQSIACWRSSAPASIHPPSRPPTAQEVLATSLSFENIEGR